jgi:hypothetical protein
MARQYTLSTYLLNTPYNYTSKVFGRFAKGLKATISFVMSFRPFVRMEQLGF